MIQRLHPIDHPRKIELLPDRLARLFGDAPCEGAVEDDGAQRRGERGGVGGGDEEARLPVADHLGEASGARGDDGDAERHRLQDHHPEPLVERGKGACIGEGEDRHGILADAEEADAAVEAEGAGVRLECGALGAVADEEELDAVEAGEGVEEVGVPLLAREAADGDDERGPFGHAEGGAGGRVGLCEGADAVGVDGVVDRLAPRGAGDSERDELGALELREGDDAVGDERGKALDGVEDGDAERVAAHAGDPRGRVEDVAVGGVDDGGAAEGGEATEGAGLGGVRVDDIEAACADDRAETPEGLEVCERPRVADELGDAVDGEAGRLGLLEERSFAPRLCARGDVDLVASGSETRGEAEDDARRAAADEPGDDVEDSHRAGNGYHIARRGSSPPRACPSFNWVIGYRCMAIHTDVRQTTPRLEAGDRLTREEFERRYDAMPNLKKAELIEGVVYMPSPARFSVHGQPHAHLTTWLVTYAAATPGTAAADNATLRLDNDNEPQPDALLRLEEKLGGRSRVDEGDYIVGPPELIAEVTASTVSYDLGPKLQTYRRHGVLEYVAWRVLDAEVDWFVLRGGRYDRLSAGADGVFRSEAFPGLWLDAAALLAGQMGSVLETLRRGLESPEHAAFLERLRRK